MKQRVTIRLWAVLLVFLFLGNTTIFAHGGEDHGDQALPTTSNKGTVTRTAKLGDMELTLKHSVLIPDTASSGKLFLTEFQTNVPVEGATAVIEFESTDGTVVQAAVEKTDSPGAFIVKIPALPEGSYTVRSKVTAKSATDAATFSGVGVTHTDSAETTSIFGWAKTLLVGILFLMVAALFGLLLYFALREPIGTRLHDEAVPV
ncbi:MAG: hypothetical protein ABIV21_02175 [Pyrinomonadaceae bacterium]